MSSGPTASETIGIIGVTMYRQRAGRLARLNCQFVAVQTDWKWMQWYWFNESLNSKYELEFVDNHNAVEDIADGFGPNNHEFRRGDLHLSRPLRVDQLTGSDAAFDARLFVRPGPRKDVWATIEVQFPPSKAYPSGTQLTIREIHLDKIGGLLPAEVNAGRRGKLAMLGKPEPFAKSKLLHPGLDPTHYMQSSRSP